jgi:hypothetical protein
VVVAAGSRETAPLDKRCFLTDTWVASRAAVESIERTNILTVVTRCSRQDAIESAAHQPPESRRSGKRSHRYAEAAPASVRKSCRSRATSSTISSTKPSTRWWRLSGKASSRRCRNRQGRTEAQGYFCIVMEFRDGKDIPPTIASGHSSGVSGRHAERCRRDWACCPARRVVCMRAKRRRNRAAARRAGAVPRRAWRRGRP